VLLPFDGEIKMYIFVNNACQFAECNAAICMTFTNCIRDFCCAEQSGTFVTLLASSVNFSCYYLDSFDKSIWAEQKTERSGQKIGWARSDFPENARTGAERGAG